MLAHALKIYVQNRLIKIINFTYTDCILFMKYCNYFVISLNTRRLTDKW